MAAMAVFIFHTSDGICVHSVYPLFRNVERTVNPAEFRYPCCSTTHTLSLSHTGDVNGNVKCRSLTDLSSASRLDCFHENMKSGFVMGLAVWWPARRMRDVE